MKQKKARRCKCWRIFSRFEQTFLLFLEKSALKSSDISTKTQCFGKKFQQNLVLGYSWHGSSDELKRFRKCSKNRHWWLFTLRYFYIGQQNFSSNSFAYLEVYTTTLLPVWFSTRYAWGARYAKNSVFQKSVDSGIYSFTESPAARLPSRP